MLSPVDLGRMLEKCERLQWSVDDLDWTVTPRELSEADEQAIVQYFTDMAGIELLAAELFRVQRDNAEDPTLRAIFDSFVVDEIRHSECAARLADHYNARRHRTYQRNPHLVRFSDHFVDALRHFAPDIANAYITTGELLLDIALLRSIDDFVDDAMSKQAMELINRDESRHIAMDYYMVEYYSSPEYAEIERKRASEPLREQMRGWMALSLFMYHSGPFFRDVFFRPMDLVDPTGKRLLEAFKRMQLLGTNPRVAARPFSKFLTFMQQLYLHPVSGPLVGKVVARVLGLDPRVIQILYTAEEEAAARRMSVEELAEEALQAKYSN